jgi:hypothetical protein
MFNNFLKTVLIVSTMKKKKSKLTFIDSAESAEAIQEKIRDKKLVNFDLWVRTPDSEKLDKLLLPARLCGSRHSCVAVIEDEF